MAEIQIPTKLQRILQISLILIFISTVTVFFIGGSLRRVQKDTSSLRYFLENTQNAQINFEKSLEIYTDRTKEIIDYILELRPETEEEYVQFISQIEQIGTNLGINIELESITDNSTEAAVSAQNSLDYNISFYGTIINLKTFLLELENLDYFIKVEKISYSNASFLTTDEQKRPNITLTIKLYIK